MTDPRVAIALQRGRLVDITTTGRRSGRPHRIEIPYFNVEGRLFIVGDPRTHDEARLLRPSDWYANLVAHPEFVLHLKRSYRVDLGELVADVLTYDDPIDADVQARAAPVLEVSERRQVLEAILPLMGRRNYQYDLDDWLEHAPMVEAIPKMR
jgi:hypothetical protein